jgi:hypothetical protein
METQGIKCIGHLPRSVGDFCPGIAMDIALYPPRNNLTIAVMPTGKFNQRRNEQRMLLHQSKHTNPKI